jgi:hypothetical protein
LDCGAQAPLWHAPEAHPLLAVDRSLPAPPDVKAALACRNP